MVRLPLFPLPVVLFPGASLPLHIFEPRYRAMVTHCLETDRRFGLIYHDADESGPFLNERGRVGCVGEIDRYQPLPGGRSLIRVTGVHRFRITEGVDDGSAPWYEAQVAAHDDLVRTDPEVIRAMRDRTLALLHEVLRSLPDPPDQVPCFGLERDLSYQLAPLVQIDGRWHQSLLELRDETYRLERLDAVFQAAIDKTLPDGEEGVA